MCKEFRRNLTGWFWLRVSQKVAIKMLVRAVVIRDLMGARGYNSNVHCSCGYWQKPHFLPDVERRLHSLTCGLLHIAAWISSQHGPWLLPEHVIQERIRRRTQCLIWLNVRSHTPSLLSHSIHEEWVPNSSPHSSIRLHLLKKVSKDFWTFLSHCK